MKTSIAATRLAGIALLCSLALIVAAVDKIPSYDARDPYFSQSIPNLFAQQDEWTTGLGMLALTSVFVILAGVLLILAFSRSGRSNPLPGSILIISGIGFLLSAGLGWKAFRIIEKSG